MREKTYYKRVATNIQKLYKKNSDYIRYKVSIYNRETKKQENVGTFLSLDDAIKARDERKSEIQKIQDGRKKRGQIRKQAHQEEYIGKRFGRLVVKSIYSNYHRYVAKCHCDCSNDTEVNLANLLSGKTRSCGCIRVEVGKKKLDNQLFQGTRISNLKYKANNQTGVKGVYPIKNGYRAIIWVQNEKIDLGTFDTIEEGKKAREEAEERYHKPLIKAYLQEKKDEEK